MGTVRRVPRPARLGVAPPCALPVLWRRHRGGWAGPWVGAPSSCTLGLGGGRVRCAPPGAGHLRRAGRRMRACRDEHTLGRSGLLAPSRTNVCAGASSSFKGELLPLAAGWLPLPDRHCALLCVCSLRRWCGCIVVLWWCGAGEHAGGPRAAAAAHGDAAAHRAPQAPHRERRWPGVEGGPGRGMEGAGGMWRCLWLPHGWGKERPPTRRHTPRATRQGHG